MKSDPIDELERLVSRMLDHSLSNGEATRLNSILRESAEARERYLELLDNHEALCAIYPGDVYEAALDTSAALPASAIDEPAEAARILEMPFPWRPWLAAAAVLALALTIVSNREKAASDQANAPLAREMAGVTAPDTVARLVAVVEAKWLNAQHELGSSLAVGEYTLTQGTADLEFNDGARVSLRGPATFELKSAAHLHLLSGNLVARIPEDALGFSVTTPQSEVVDLGTEFGLSVKAGGQTDVHVFNGLVEVLTASETNQASQASVQLREGEAGSFDAGQGEGLKRIAMTTRQALLGGNVRDSGLELLRGAIRFLDEMPSIALQDEFVGSEWIYVIPERKNVRLEEALEVAITAPGVYRDYVGLSKILPAGTMVDSYLLHFRPAALEPVSGVIRFDRPVVGIICTDTQLHASDGLLGIPGGNYPEDLQPWRGVEPSGAHAIPLPESIKRPSVKYDELTLSQQGTTISVRMVGIANQGIDQIRVLTLSAE